MNDIDTRILLHRLEDAVAVVVETGRGKGKVPIDEAVRQMTAAWDAYIAEEMMAAWDAYIAEEE